MRLEEAVGGALELRVERQPRDAVIGRGRGGAVVAERDAGEVDPAERGGVRDGAGTPEGKPGKLGRPGGDDATAAARAAADRRGDAAPCKRARARKTATAASPTATPAPSNRCLIRGFV